MSIWLMKAARETGSLFLDSPRPFVGIDQAAMDRDYSNMSPEERTSLFLSLQQAGSQGLQYGAIKRIFDDFCFVMAPGDLVFLGVGETGEFFLSAILQVLSRAFFVTEAPRQRRHICPLWRGEPFYVPQWADTRRLDKLEECTGAIRVILAQFCKT